MDEEAKKTARAVFAGAPAKTRPAIFADARDELDGIDAEIEELRRAVSDAEARAGGLRALVIVGPEFVTADELTRQDRHPSASRRDRRDEAVSSAASRDHARRIAGEPSHVRDGEAQRPRAAPATAEPAWPGAARLPIGDARDPDMVRRARNAQVIGAMIETGASSAPAIGEAIGMGRSTVVYALSQLSEAGLVEKQGRGKYVPTEDGRAGYREFVAALEPAPLPEEGTISAA